MARDSRRNQFHTDHRLASGEIRHVEAFSGPILLGGRNLLYAIVHDVSQRVKIERELKRRYESETLAAALATRFINPQSEEIDREISAAMREIGEFAGVDRCQLIEFTADLRRVGNVYRWFRDLPENRGLKLEDLDMRQFPWASRRISHSEPLVINSVKELPEEAAAEVLALIDSGTRSLIAIPLHAGAALLGAFVIQTVADERWWDASDVLLMRVTSEMLVNVLVRRRYEEEIGHSRDRLKDLSAHIQDRIESERASIAREVHDELGQLLTALKFDISWLKNKVPEDNPALVDKSRIMSEIIDEAVRCVQRITAELRPVLLDDLGIAAAIDWLAREFSERTGIVSHLELDEINADGPMAITLFRITQEALTNVGRHSFATELDISLKNVSGGVRLEIRDNGVGISEAQLADPTSYGLMGIQERAGFLDGVVSIRGSKGEGTRIEVFLPVRKKKRKTQ
jgi:signal transduction histidine kinase